jgi:putative membrane protein
VWSKFLEWRGVLAIAVFAVTSLWLAFDGRLGFYIHPRYNLFTIAMATIAVVLIVIASVTVSKHDHDHDHDHDHPRRGRRRWKPLDLASLAVTVLVAGAFILLPPATLSSATAENRSTNEVDLLSSGPDVSEGMSNEVFATLTVRDWASLIVQNQNASFYRGKPVNALGIVTPVEGSDDVFNLTRFVVTCCAVDAQPVSIPVFLPDWRNSIAADSWVRIEGGFQPAPTGVIGSPVAVVPVSITNEEVPREPYLF